MKIENLYTRGQFIDLMDELYPPSEPETAEEYQFYVSRYNYFLKQATTRDKFVCEIVKPEIVSDIASDYSRMKYANRMFEYEEAQKKVIFENHEKLEMDNDGIWYRGVFVHFNTPLSVVAEKTNGELKLKNIEI